MLKLKDKAARPAGQRMIFGKVVEAVATKASKVVKAFPAKAFTNAVYALTDLPTIEELETARAQDSSRCLSREPSVTDQ